MDNKKVIGEEQFVKEVLKPGTNSFIYQRQREELFQLVTQAEIGSGKLVYSAHIPEDTNCPDPSINAALVALIRDETVYLFDRVAIHPIHGPLLSNTVDFFDEMDKFVTQLEQEIYDMNESCEIMPLSEEEKKYAMEQARRILIYGTSLDEQKGKHTLGFLPNDYMEHLLGMKDLKRIAAEKGDIEKEQWQKKRSQYLLIKKLVQEGTAATKAEIKIAECARRTNAVYLQIEFTVDEVAAVGKMSPNTLLKNIYENTSFSTYDFANKVNSQILFKKLGCKDIWGRALTYNDISKIMYRGKVIYEKK